MEAQRDWNCASTVSVWSRFVKAQIVGHPFEGLVELVAERHWQAWQEAKSQREKSKDPLEDWVSAVLVPVEDRAAARSADVEALDATDDLENAGIRLDVAGKSRLQDD